MSRGGALWAVLEVHRRRVGPQRSEHRVRSRRGGVVEHAAQVDRHPLEAGDELGAAVAQGGHVVEAPSPEKAADLGDVCAQVSLDAAGVVDKKLRDLGIEKGHVMLLPA